jgi:YVTN family beta-propeller protein
MRMIRRAQSFSSSRGTLAGFTLVLVMLILTTGLLWWPSKLNGFTLPVATRSTTIAMTTDDTRLVVVNRETNSVSVIQVRVRVFGVPIDTEPVKLGEAAVGKEPRCVALNPDNTEAYVTNGASGTVSVVSLVGPPAAVAEIPVRGEPWGCAMAPNGTSLFVADHTAGEVVEIDPASRTIRRTIPVGGNPAAIAITNNGDTVDTDETVFVSQFFAELIPGGPGEGFDTGKRGVVQAFRVGSTAVSRITLSPLSDAGFTATRVNFCPQTAPNPALLQSTIFCPDLSAPVGSPIITQNPQGAFPNQLHALLIRGDQLLVPSIGAQPSPPVMFNVNVQALLHVVSISALSEFFRFNVNTVVRLEPPPPDPTTSLAGLFLNDFVDIEANANGTLLCGVSRGGNQLVCANPGSTTLTRFQTGNIPNGVVFNADGTRAYVNNEVNISVSIIDLAGKTVLARDVPSGTPPALGTVEHSVLVGKLAFFTALGIPNNGIFDIPIRDFNPLQFRGKQSNNGWSSCASCHPDGLSDNVTWIFANGPRSTIPLDGAHSKHNIANQRVYLWSASRGSNTDFNNNSRNVQGGIGFADDPAAVYDHGPVFGVSDALDAQTFWLASAIRSRRQPAPDDPAAVARGAALFAASCRSCHGGAKWTKSTILYGDNPAFNKNPAAGGVPIDPGVVNAGAQIVSYTRGGLNFKYLEAVGTFNAASPLEIAANGQRALGALGFNVPSLLSLGSTAPYLHHGAAQTLPDVFPLHGLGAGTIESSFSAGQRSDLLLFLKSIDGRTDGFRSEAEEFIDTLAQ